MATVRKAVIPAAGFGTRFLPASKVQPKEMLPIVDTPVIQYVVEEAVEAGITDILIVTGRGKSAIEDHFDRSPELERALEARGRVEDLERLRRLTSMAQLHFVRQPEMKGLGDAVACARRHVGDEPFAVLLGDTLVQAAESVTAQLARLYASHGGGAVAVQAIDRSLVDRYGVMDGEEVEPGVYRVRDFVEKPRVEDAPSNLVIAGRYVFGPELFEHLARTERGKHGEIQLTDAMRSLVAVAPMFGLRFAGRRYDIGNKLEFVKTNVLCALQRPDMQADMAAFLRSLL